LHTTARIVVVDLDVVVVVVVDLDSNGDVARDDLL